MGLDICRIKLDVGSIYSFHLHIRTTKEVLDITTQCNVSRLQSTSANILVSISIYVTQEREGKAKVKVISYNRENDRIERKARYT